MKSDDTLRLEMEAVNRLGESIGYGNLISWASALWRDSLRKRGLPESGAFIGVCECSIKADCLEGIRSSESVYDSWLHKLEGGTNNGRG